MNSTPAIECESAPRTARRLLLAFDTGEQLVALFGIRYGVPLLLSSTGGQTSLPLLHGGLQNSVPLLGAREWGALMLLWGVWALWGVRCGVRTRGGCYKVRKATMMSGMLLWFAVAYLLWRYGHPVDAWATYPLLAMACCLKYWRLCARQKADTSGRRRACD